MKLRESEQEAFRRFERGERDRTKREKEEEEMTEEKEKGSYGCNILGRAIARTFCPRYNLDVLPISQTHCLT